MRITAKQLKRLIKEAAVSSLNEDHDLDQYDEYMDDDNGSTFFLHGDEDEEGAMAKGQLHRIKEISYMICDMVEEDDQLPAWVQSHIAIAYENLNQVLSYMEPKYHMSSEEDEDYDYEADYEEYDEYEDDEMMPMGEGLWDNVWARRRAGKAPKKPGQKGFPSPGAWAAATGGKKKKRK